MTHRNWKPICAVILSLSVGSAWAHEKTAVKPVLLPMPAPVPCPAFVAVPPAVDLEDPYIGLNTLVLAIANEAKAAGCWIEVKIVRKNSPMLQPQMDSAHDEECPAASMLPEPMCIPTQAPPLAAEPLVAPTFVPTGWFTPAGSSVSYPVPAPSKLPPAPTGWGWSTPLGSSVSSPVPAPSKLPPAPVDAPVSASLSPQCIAGNMATESAPAFSIRATHDNQVEISTPKMTATADHLSPSEKQDVWLLQGNVQLCIKDNGAHVQVSEGQVAVHLCSGHVEILAGQR